MNIAIAYSPNWKQYIPILLYSIIKNNINPMKIYLLSESDGELKLEIDYVQFIDCNKIYNQRIQKETNVDNRITKFALYRLLLPELIQDDKILYLDVDIIVNGNIQELYDIDIENYYVAGVSDIGIDRAALMPHLGLNLDDIYINSGVILLNLKNIRKDLIYEKWIYEVNEHSYIGRDQSIINKTCKDKIKIIDNKFNVSISTGLNASENIIIHYTGIKPWVDNKVPNYNFWEKYKNEYLNSASLIL